MWTRICFGVSMKRVAQTVSKKAVSRVLAVLAIASLMSGCAVVGPILSIGGMAGLGPLQYASMAYTAGEFSYEYAANDNTPDEVIENKINAFVTGEAFELPEYMQDDPAGPEAPVMVAEADTPEDPALSAEAREKRIEKLLGKRRIQHERLELRRMAFLKAQSKNQLSLRQTAMASNPDLFHGAIDEVSLD